MRLLLGTLLALVTAAFVGLGTTWLAVTRGAPFGALTIGAWTAWPREGTSDVDPYSRATIARSGELPLGAGDGLTFRARTTDSGTPLDGRCEVTVSGITPTARYWTLTLYDDDGQLVANSVSRYGFTSQEILRAADGRFEIVVGPRARPGNWLPTSGIESYILALRLYDTPIGAAKQVARDTPMPVVAARPCP